VTRDELTGWIGAYEAAWRSGEGVHRLFTPDARYRSSPYMDPYAGIAAIEEFWKRETDEGEEFTVDSEIVAIEGDTGVVRLEVDYTAPEQRHYRDIWIVTLGAEGLCTAFEEWPFWPPGSDG
jgi:ketosteroid isomerase-like protein